MRVLVTGATGFVGSNLVRFLCNKGYRVVAVGKKEEQELPYHPNLEVIYAPFYEIDLDEIGPIDVLFHQAAIVNTTFTNEKEMLFVNTEKAAELFKEVIKRGCKRIVYASSTAVYGNSPAPFIEGKGEQPLNVYGISKLSLDHEATKLAKLHPECVIVGLRYCNVFGPGESHKGKMATMIHQLMEKMKMGENPAVFKHGEQKRDFIYVKDVLEANLLASKAKKSCIVNCGTGKPVTFNFIIKQLQEILGTNRQIEYLDNPYSHFFQVHTECDMKLAKDLIGFEPKWDFREALKDLYLKENIVKVIPK